MNVTDTFFEYSAENGIHHLRLLQATGKGIQAMLKHMEEHVVEKPLDGKNLVLLDFRSSGLPPMIEALPYLVAFFARQPRRTPQPVRAAYIYPRDQHGQVLKVFLSLHRLLPQGATVKFFTHMEIEAAIQWLTM